MQNLLLPLKLASLHDDVLEVNSVWFLWPVSGVCTRASLVFSAHLPTGVWLKPFSSRKSLVGLDLVPFPLVHGTAPDWCFLEAPEVLTKRKYQKRWNP